MKKIYFPHLFLTVATLMSFFIPQTAEAKSLAVPFTPQAPKGDWRQPWADFCEEASVLMVDSFYANKKLNQSEAKKELLRIDRIKRNALGKSLDEDVSKMVELINQFLPWEAEIIDNPSLEQIKREIDAGRPVIAPVYGRGLRNPYFRNGGPDYHVVVISGYDEEKEEFITQDSGTRRGANFRYSYKILMDAIHDFTYQGNTINGPKKVLFTSKEFSDSASFDGDQDGLTKEEEIKYGTITWLKDSDGDGYEDGLEVKLGYLPNLAEAFLPNGSLIKSFDKPEVYILRDNIKYHILNEYVFKQGVWRESEIKIVSNQFIDLLKEGNVVCEN